MPRILKVQLPHQTSIQQDHFWVHLQTKRGWPEITDQIPELPPDVHQKVRATNNIAYFEAEEGPGRRWTFLRLSPRQI